jgi:hypothetical protein
MSDSLQQAALLINCLTRSHLVSSKTSPALEEVTLRRALRRMRHVGESVTKRSARSTPIMDSRQSLPKRGWPSAYSDDVLPRALLVWSRNKTEGSWTPTVSTSVTPFLGWGRLLLTPCPESRHRAPHNGGGARSQPGAQGSVGSPAPISVSQQIAVSLHQTSFRSAIADVRAHWTSLPIWIG